MTNAELRNKIVRVRGLKVLDPWGVLGRVHKLDGEHVWLFYDGLAVPFERLISECVDAANGQVRSDLDEQYVKRFVVEPGIDVAFEYEPFWIPVERQGKAIRGV